MDATFEKVEPLPADPPRRKPVGGARARRRQRGGSSRARASLTDTSLGWAASAELILFGSFELRPAERALLNKGEPLRVGSRAFELLLVLVEARGAIVSKDELTARVWPRTHVVEVNLRVHVAALRKVLNAERPGRYIVTVPGRGYC